MALRVSGKNLDVGEALRGQITERISHAIRRFYEGGVTGHVIVEPVFAPIAPCTCPPASLCKPKAWPMTPI